MESRVAPTSVEHTTSLDMLRRRLPIVLGALTGMVICGIVFAVIGLLAPHPPGPAPTARALCADLMSQNYAEVYALLSPQQQSLGTQAQFIASQRELDALSGRVTNCATTLVSDNAGTAQATLSVTRGTAAVASSGIQLVLDGTAWRVSGYDNSIVRVTDNVRWA